eukprot:300975_1
MDDVAFSADDWVDIGDILCTWQHSDFTPQSSFRNWNNIILYDLCKELQDVNCNMLIDTQFDENDYDYSLHLCDHMAMQQTDANVSFVFDAVINDEMQTYDVFINTLWFDLDLDYYSANVNTFHLNYSKCSQSIMHLSSTNQTTNYGIHPCYILDLTNNPTSDPSEHPSNNPSNSPTKDPT